MLTELIEREIMMRVPLFAGLAAACLAGAGATHALGQDALTSFEQLAVTTDTTLVSYCGACTDPGCGCPECGAGCDEGGCCDEIGCGSGCCSACGKKAAKKPNPCATSHKVLFYANDFSYLKKPGYCGNCLGDCLKLMPVGPCGKYGTLDIGGQVRLRYHHEYGMGRQPGRLGFQDTTNEFLLSRLRLYGNWKVSDNLRVFVEGISANQTGNDLYVPRPIDTNYGDLLNAFVDAKLTDEFTVRVGRQELLYGAQRTVSPLDWANTRRTFEGIRGLYKTGDWAIDGFYTNLVPVVDNQFDEADYDRSFYGLYGTYNGFEQATAEAYYLGFDNELVGAPVSTDFSLHTVGGRLNGKAGGDWLYDVEGAYQGGRQSGLMQDHSAGFITAGLGRKIKHDWNPTLWLYFDYASGNDSTSGDFNRFNQLFPLAHKYLGFIDAVARENVVSPNVLLTMAPAEKWKLLMWYYYFGAAQEDDVIPGVAVPSAQRLDENDFGHELDFIARYQIVPRSNILFGYSHLWRGDKIIGTNDADFFYTQWELNF